MRESQDSIRDMQASTQGHKCLNSRDWAETDHINFLEASQRALERNAFNLLALPVKDVSTREANMVSQYNIGEDKLEALIKGRRENWETEKARARSGTAV